MNDEPNQPSPTASVLILIGIFSLGYFGYSKLFPSDLAKLRSCISSTMEASRGDSLYGQYRAALSEIDAAKEVLITSQRRYPMGGDDILSIEYKIDGRQRGIMCVR